MSAFHGGILVLKFSENSLQLELRLYQNVLKFENMSLYISEGILVTKNA